MLTALLLFDLAVSVASAVVIFKNIRVMRSCRNVVSRVANKRDK